MRCPRFAPACAAALLLAATAPAAIPVLVTVQGVLEDPSGAPLPGTRDWRVRYYDGAAGDQLLAERTGSTALGERGVFAFDVELPDAVFVAADLHYELSLDADAAPNGLDANDVFPVRVRVTSVPFARRAAAAGTAESAGSASTAASAVTAQTADFATTAGSATTAQTTDTATTADSATTAATATNALSLGGKPASAFGPRLFEAVVDAAGGGDFTTIQDAIASGARSIHVRNGNYTISGAHPVLPRGGFRLVGESREGVRISLLSARSLVFAGDSGLPYREGTVNARGGLATVTAQSGAPQWLANAAAGDIIRIGRTFHRIASVDSNTQITLTRAYGGRDMTGVSYAIASHGSGFHFENLTFQNAPDLGTIGAQDATGGAICLRFARDIVIRNCGLEATGNGARGPLAYLENCHLAEISSCRTDNAGLLKAVSSAELSVVGNTTLGAGSSFAAPLAIYGVGNDEPLFGIHIADNQFLEGTGGLNFAAIYLGYVSTTGIPFRGDFSITGNTIRDFRSVDPTVSASAGAIHLGNAFVGTGVISGNAVNTCVGSGIVLNGTGYDGLTITGNVLTGNSGYAIRTTGGSHNNLLVTGNVMTGNALGGANMAGVTYGTMNVPRFEEPVP
jgi:hypothetical protein